MGKARDLACYNEFVLRDRVRYSNRWLHAHPRSWAKHWARQGTVVRIRHTSAGVFLGVLWDGNQRPMEIFFEHLEKRTYASENRRQPGAPGSAGESANRR